MCCQASLVIVLNKYSGFFNQWNLFLFEMELIFLNAELVSVHLA